MRIDRIGNEIDESLFEVARAVTVAVPHSQNAVAFGEVNPAVGTEFEIHGLLGSGVEDLAGAVRIKSENLVVFGTRIILGWQVSMTGNRPDPALIIDIHAGGCGDVRVFCDEG